MVDVERQKDVTTTLLDRGYRQQQIADELLADADAARDMARKAVAKAEATLSEANETLRTLRGLMWRNYCHLRICLSRVIDDLANFRRTILRGLNLRTV